MDKESCESWLQTPETKRLREYARAQREQRKEDWASGGLSHVEHFATACANSAAIGACSAYEDFIALDFDQIAGDSNDERAGQDAGN